MKKIIISLFVAIASTMCTNAQNLTQQMLNLYKGNVKTIVQRVEGIDGEAVTRFDRTGKITSVEQGGGKMDYSWSSDNKSVELKGYVNGQYQGAQMLYIKEMTSTNYKYETGGVTYTVEFKKNGAINKQTMSANGQSQTTFFYFKRPDDLYPYKAVTSMGGQSMTVTSTVLSTDSYGNPTKISQSSNGQTMTMICEITYY